jgi:hypothetical protein
MIDLRLRPERGVALTHLYWQMAERLHKMPGVRNSSLVDIPPLFGIAKAQFSVLDEKNVVGIGQTGAAVQRDWLKLLLDTRHFFARRSRFCES